MRYIARIAVEKSLAHNLPIPIVLLNLDFNQNKKNMKNISKLMLSAALVGSITIACNKEEDPANNNNNNNTPTVTCKLLSFSEVQDSSSNGSSLEFNSDGKVIKVNHTYGTNSQADRYDSVAYNSDGTINKIFSVDVNWPEGSKTFTYAYASGKISVVTETGTTNSTPYTKTWTITWTNGYMSKIEASGDPNGENAVYKNITFVSGNIKTVEMDFSGTGQMSIKMEVTQVDAKKNVGRFMLPFPEELIEYYNTNNIVKVSTSDQALIPNGWDPVTNTFTYDTIPAGTVMLDREYTYTSNNEVNTKIEKPSGMDDPNDSNRTTTYTYECN